MRRNWMNFDTKRAARLALIGLAAASLAACASRPKPAGPAPVAPSEPSSPSAPYTPPPSPVAQGAIPGSVQDFVINIGERIYFDTDEYVVRSDAQPVLAAQAQWLNRYPAVRV
ncbi:MAG: peptidoglycan-associated lipoprotein, partial [Caulobacter sp. 12-67-6]